MTKWLSFALATAMLSGCATSPTGRTQFLLISPEAAIVESRRAYATAMQTVGAEGKFLDDPLLADRLSSEALLEAARDLARLAERGESADVQPQTQAPAGFRTRAPFYSPKVKRKVLLALDFIAPQRQLIADHLRLAFAATMVDYSNYSYEPSLGRKAAVGRPDAEDFAVL